MKFEFKPEMWPVKHRKFNPEQWGEKSIKKRPNGAVYHSKSTASVEHEVEVVLQRIEAAHLDLTCDRDDWVKLGFAFATQFGEGGRSFFHRVSRFYTDYDWIDCNKKYNESLRNGRSVVTIRTFFGMARDAGIDICQKNERINTSNLFINSEE